MRTAPRFLILAKLGHLAGRRTGGLGTAHRIGLLLSSMIGLLTIWIFVGAHAVSDERGERIAAREGVVVNTDEEASANWAVRADHFRDRQYLVISIAPIKANAAPPPGLTRWPEPGEAFLSPALLAADRAGFGRTRYGSFGGTIRADGLADPNEWIVYLRPMSDIFQRYDGPVRVSGFGRTPTQDNPALTADPAGRTLNELYWLLAITVALPTALLAMIAVRSAAEVRDRRLAMLSALGSPRLAKGWVVLGESFLPVVIGNVVGVALALTTTFTGMYLPVVNFQIRADDLATGRGLIPLISMGWLAFLLAASVAVQLRNRRVAGTLPRQSRTQLSGWGAIVFMASLALLTWLSATSYKAGGVSFGSLRTQLFLAVLLVVLATLPLTVAIVAAPLGLAVARLGRRQGWAAALIGGRWLTDRSAALARMSAALVVGLAVLTLAQVLVSQAAEAGRSSAVRTAVGDALVTVRATDARLDRKQFTAVIGADQVLSAVDDPSGKTIITGSCAALAALGEMPTCPNSPTPVSAVYQKVSKIGHNLLSQRATILLQGEVLISGPTDAGGVISGFVVFNQNGASGVERIKSAAYRTLAFPDVTTSGQYAIAGSVELARTYSWLGALGTLGVLILIIASALGVVDTFLSQLRGIGILGSMTADRKTYVGVAAWNIGLSLVVAGLAGAVVSVVLGILFARLRSTGSVSLPFLGINVLGIVLLAAVLAVVCGELALRSAKKWRPTSD